MAHRPEFLCSLHHVSTEALLLLLRSAFFLFPPGHGKKVNTSSFNENIPVPNAPNIRIGADPSSGSCFLFTRCRTAAACSLFFDTSGSNHWIFFISTAGDLPSFESPMTLARGGRSGQTRLISHLATARCINLWEMGVKRAAAAGELTLP